MGLDMFLYHRTEEAPATLDYGPTGEKRELPNGTFYDVWGPRNGWTEVAYWRKANAVHDWFVTNVQFGEDDCGYYPVQLSQLGQLRDTIDGVLGDFDTNRVDVNDPDFVVPNDLRVRALDALPPKDGFFFGGQEVDAWYLRDLVYTKSVVDEVLNTIRYGQYIYHSSW